MTIEYGHSTGKVNEGTDASNVKNSLSNVMNSVLIPAAHQPYQATSNSQHLEKAAYSKIFPECVVPPLVLSIQYWKPKAVIYPKWDGN